MLKPHARNLRKGRFSEGQRIYLITTVTMKREVVFSDFYAARHLINILKKEEVLGAAETLAFVVMPDHLHWLMQLGNIHSLSKVVATIKSTLSHRLGRKIWQPGFYDHALRKEEDIRGSARYIVANPLRAGLVKHIGDYPHWDAKWL